MASGGGFNLVQLIFALRSGSPVQRISATAMECSFRSMRPARSREGNPVWGMGLWWESSQSAPDNLYTARRLVSRIASAASPTVASLTIAKSRNLSGCFQTKRLSRDRNGWLIPFATVFSLDTETRPVEKEMGSRALLKIWIAQR